MGKNINDEDNRIKKPTSFKTNDKFEDGINFEKIYELYEFDKRLRNMFIGILETIEITFRTQISYLIAHKYGTLGHKDPENFMNSRYHNGMIKDMERETYRSDEIFIQHHIEEYKGVVPVWVSIEVTSLGTLSKMYSNLINKDKSKISKGIWGSSCIYYKLVTCFNYNKKYLCALWKII